MQLSTPPTGDTPVQKLPWPPEDGPGSTAGQPLDVAVKPSPYEGAPEPLMDRVTTFLQVPSLPADVASQHVLSKWLIPMFIIVGVWIDLAWASSQMQRNLGSSDHVLSC